MHFHFLHFLHGHHNLLVLAVCLYVVLRVLFFGVSAMVLHELGHLAASLMLGVKVKTGGFRMKGMYIVREAGDDFQNLVISISGPLLNLGFMLVFWNISPMFCLANFLFFGFNILPLHNSDGDRAWGCWLRLREKRSFQAGD